jgi:hypothetical protein
VSLARVALPSGLSRVAAEHALARTPPFGGLDDERAALEAPFVVVDDDLFAADDDLFALSSVI